MKKKIEDLLKTYHRNGFVKLGRVASISYSKKLSNRIQDLMSGKKQYKGMFFQLEGEKGKYENINKDSEIFLGPSKRYRKIKDLEYDNLFFKIVKNKYLKYFSKNLIGNDISCMRAMVLNKPPKHSSKLKFHQDASDNWKMSSKPNFTFWMSLNGATKRKGCLKIIEGSHRYGKLGNGHFASKSTLQLFKKSKIKYLELKPGEAIIFNNFLLHGSEQNKTLDMRLAFTVCLMDAKIKHTKSQKRYPKIFGKGSLQYNDIKKITAIPKKTYKI